MELASCQIQNPAFAGKLCTIDLNNRKMEQVIDILKRPILALYINV